MFGNLFRRGKIVNGKFVNVPRKVLTDYAYHHPYNVSAIQSYAPPAAAKSYYLGSKYGAAATTARRAWEVLGGGRSKGGTKCLTQPRVALDGVGQLPTTMGNTVESLVSCITICNPMHDMISKGGNPQSKKHIP